MAVFCPEASRVLDTAAIFDRGRDLIAGGGNDVNDEVPDASPLSATTRLEEDKDEEEDAATG